jgi:hypothetical protein
LLAGEKALAHITSKTSFKNFLFGISLPGNTQKKL